MNTTNTTQVQNPKVFTLPEGMSRDEAFDRLIKNTSKYPSVKDVYVDPMGNNNILILKGKYCKYEFGLINNVATVKQRQSLFTVIAMILVILTFIIFAIAAVMYYTVGIPYEWVDLWFIPVIFIAVAMPVSITTAKESNIILAYIKHDLGVMQ